MTKRVGTNTGSIESSPRYRRKQAARRAREEARWAALSGPARIVRGDPLVTGLLVRQRDLSGEPDGPGAAAE